MLHSVLENNLSVLSEFYNLFAKHIDTDYLKALFLAVNFIGGFACCVLLYNNKYILDMNKYAQFNKYEQIRTVYTFNLLILRTITFSCISCFACLVLLVLHLYSVMKKQ